MVASFGKDRCSNPESMKKRNPFEARGLDGWTNQRAGTGGQRENGGGRRTLSGLVLDRGKNDTRVISETPVDREATVGRLRRV